MDQKKKNYQYKRQIPMFMIILKFLTTHAVVPISKSTFFFQILVTIFLMDSWNDFFRQVTIPKIYIFGKFDFLFKCIQLCGIPVKDG